MNKSNLVDLIVKRIKEASEAKQTSLILTPKAHNPNMLGDIGTDLANELAQIGYRAELSKDGNLDDCLRITW
jgi:hypothetical protein